MNTRTPICTWEELRGDIIASTIADDNEHYAFSSNEGYLYYGKLSDCSIKKYNKTDFRFKSTKIITATNEVWVCDGVNSIIVVNYLTDTVQSFNVPTDSVNSIMLMTADNLVGVCTQRAFYVIDHSRSIQYTLVNPSLITKTCRMLYLGPG